MYREQVICRGCGTLFESHQRSRIYCCKICWYFFRITTSGHKCCHCDVVFTYQAFEAGLSLVEFVRQHERCRVAALDLNGRDDDCRCSECKRRKGITTAFPVADSVRKRRVRTHQKHRQFILDRDNYVCQVCFLPTDPSVSPSDDRYPTLDHIEAVSTGGSDDIENLRTAHKWCNTVLKDEGLFGEDMVRARAQAKFA